MERFDLRVPDIVVLERLLQARKDVREARSLPRLHVFPGLFVCNRHVVLANVRDVRGW
jgi:hypothetical protein